MMAVLGHITLLAIVGGGHLGVLLWMLYTQRKDPHENHR